MSKRRILKKNLFYLLVVFIFSVFILELGLRISFRIKENRFWNEENRYRSSVYKGSLWAKRYFEIDKILEKDYYPYYQWRRKEFRSELVNISRDGIRKTRNPEYREDLKKVFVFGGSTIWGTGVRDEFTIPSLLSKNLNRFKDSYFVINYGEAAYVSTQEVIFLIAQLREGNVPDYVIFYDGVNDIDAAFQTGKAGQIYNYSIWRMKLNMGAKIFNQMSKEALLNNSKLFSSIDCIIRKYIKKEDLPKHSQRGLEELASQIIVEYKKNINLVKKLSEIYGFKYIFIWQPSLFTVKSKTSEEQRILTARDKNLERLYTYTYELINKLDIPHFYNLSHIFDNKTEAFFIDDCHVGENQNLIIADNIFKIMRNEFKK